MKAVIMTGASAERLDAILRRRKKPCLASLVSTLHKLGADEALITGQKNSQSRFSDWYEKERGRFSTPVTLRFQGGFTSSGEMDSLMRLIVHEDLEAPVLLVFLNDDTPEDLEGFKNTHSSLSLFTLGGSKKTQSKARPRRCFDG